MSLWDAGDLLFETVWASGRPFVSPENRADIAGIVMDTMSDPSYDWSDYARIYSAHPDWTEYVIALQPRFIGLNTNFTCHSDSVFQFDPSGVPFCSGLLQIPNAPSNLQGFVTPDLSPTGVLLTWKDNSSIEDVFFIGISTDDVNFLLYGTAPANAISFSQGPPLISGVPVFFVIASSNSFGFNLSNSIGPITPQ